MLLDAAGVVNVRPGVYLKSTLLLKAVIPIRSQKGMLGSSLAVTGADRNVTLTQNTRTHTHTGALKLNFHVFGLWKAGGPLL